MTTSNTGSVVMTLKLVPLAAVTHLKASAHTLLHKTTLFSGSSVFPYSLPHTTHSKQKNTVDCDSVLVHW